MEKTRETGQTAPSMVRICYAADRSAGDEMIRKLRDAGIEAARAGGTRDIYKAESLMGEEILVPAEEAERAARLLRGEPDCVEKEPGGAAKAPAPKKSALLQIGAAVAMIAVLVLLAVLVSALPGR